MNSGFSPNLSSWVCLLDIFHNIADSRYFTLNPKEKDKKNSMWIIMAGIGGTSSTNLWIMDGIWQQAQTNLWITAKIWQ
jgi:hypothetical protein